VLCNSSNEIRVITLYAFTSNGSGFRLPQTGDSIYNQSSKTCIILCNLCANTTGFGRNTVHLVKKARPPAHFSTEYSALSKCEFQKTLDERERELVAIKAADEMKSFMEQEWAKIRGIVETQSDRLFRGVKWDQPQIRH
jgi:hypothetical protein